MIKNKPPGIKKLKKKIAGIIKKNLSHLTCIDSGWAFCEGSKETAQEIVDEMLKIFSSKNYAKEKIRKASLKEGLRHG
ncbi:MAG: hypothetical protein PHC85_02385 [Candidatus Pacebacteria bacterium]|nr:hypothetical protein [Candidatus Paceibacterota bacterium]